MPPIKNVKIIVNSTLLYNKGPSSLLGVCTWWGTDPQAGVRFAPTPYRERYNWVWIHDHAIYHEVALEHVNLETLTSPHLEKPYEYHSSWPHATLSLEYSKVPLGFPCPLAISSHLQPLHTRYWSPWPLHSKISHWSKKAQAPPSSLPTRRWGRKGRTQSSWMTSLHGFLHWQSIN